jgi:hypothetical protein
MANETPLEELEVANFSEYEWQQIIADAPRKWCIGYYAPLFAKADTLKQSEDDQGSRVFAFLGRIATLNPNY